MKIFIFSGLFLIFACHPTTQSAEASQVSTIEVAESGPATEIPEEDGPTREEHVDEGSPLPLEEIKKEVEKKEPRVKKEPAEMEISPDALTEESNKVEVEVSPPHAEKIISQPKEEDIKEVPQKEAPIARISHTLWNSLLVKNVSATGKVNYKGFISAKGEFQKYLDLLSANPPVSSWPKNEQLAFWINAYNAFTVKLIIDNYPLKSIMDLGKPWDKSFINIGGKSYTLNNIEHDIIRKQFNEPRIHFAVNCASISCPKLLNEAYTPEKLESQLRKQTQAYINNSRENSLSPTSAEISSLFDWYKGDFTKTGSLIDFINSFSQVQVSPSATISYKNYNWALNE